MAHIMMATLIVSSSEAEEEKEKEETEKEDQVDINRQQQQSKQKECEKKKKKNTDTEEDDDNDNNDTIGTGGEKEPEIISEEGKENDVCVSIVEEVVESSNCQQQQQQQQQQHSKNNNDNEDQETSYNNNTEIDNNEDNLFTEAYHTTNGQWEEKEDVKKKKKQNNRTQKEEEEEERRRRCDDHNDNGGEEIDIPTTTATTTTDGVSTPSPFVAAAAAVADGKDDYDCVKLKGTTTTTTTISSDTNAATVEEDEDEDEDKFLKLIFSSEKGNDVVGVKVKVDADVVETNDDDENNNDDDDDDDEQQLIKDATSYGAYVASCTTSTNNNNHNHNSNNSGSFDDDDDEGGDGDGGDDNKEKGGVGDKIKEEGIEDGCGSSIPMSPTTTISDNYNDTNTSGSSILKTPNTIPNQHHRISNSINKNNNSPSSINNIMINDIPIAKSTPVSVSASATRTTTTTLAAIFGDKNGVAGGLTTSATNNGDYILVGNSPYETTYDPRSSYFYNRVYGHLYITTKSLLFRGKAFGPIGAIPYERRLILPLREILRTEFYKTTSIRITMYDQEKYIFKSFDSNTRKQLLKLIHKTTKQREVEEQQQQRQQNRGRCMSYDDSIDAIIHDVNNDGADHTDSDNDNDNDSYSEGGGGGGGRSEKQRSRSVPTFRSFNSRSITTPTITATPPRLPLPSPRLFDDDDNDNDDNRNDDDAHSQFVATTPASMKSSKTPIRKPTAHLRHGSSGTPVRSLHLSVVGDGDDGDGDSNDDNDDDEYYDVPLTGGTQENTDDTATTPAMTKTPQVQDMNNNNHTAAAAGNDGDDDPATQPRRLFGSTENGASVNSIATSMMMMSPPRMMISQRRLPKTPAGNIGPPVNTAANNNDTNNDTNTIDTAAAINNNSHSHLRQPLQLRQRSQRQRTGTMSIPTIPTVPTLNTPEPTKYLKKAIDIAMLNKIASRGNVDIPISITEIQEEAAAAAAAISSSKAAAAAAAAVAATENDLAVQRAWMERKQEGKSNNDDSEWKIAVDLTVLEQCTLDNWFDLFFSDDAHFSLQNYQIKDIGDKNVKYDSWTRKKNMKSNEDGGNDRVNAEDEESNKENINDSIPELERNITFMHPISGNLMGPSEAETFRLQTLKRYGSYGAILTNTTTVGESVPMGDCFRVEDRWIIESTQSKLSNSTNNKNDKTNNDKYDSVLVPQEALTVTVKFRVVFVKRTMFKTIISKNVVSETKKWFIGYEKMMKVALKSKVHTQTIQKRRQLLLENNTIQTTTTTSMSPPSSNTMSAATTSGEKILPFTEKLDDNLTVSSPSAAPVVVAANDEDEKVTLAMSRWSVLLDILGALVRGIINTILSLPTMVSSKSIDGWYGERTAVAGMMIMLLALFLLQMNYSSMRTSLTYIEEQLHNLHIQNAILLERIEELSSVSLSSSSAAASATVE